MPPTRAGQTSKIGSTSALWSRNVVPSASRWSAPRLALAAPERR
jgi:hypothetical protein